MARLTSPTRGRPPAEIRLAYFNFANLVSSVHSPALKPNGPWNDGDTEGGYGIMRSTTPNRLAISVKWSPSTAPPIVSPTAEPTRHPTTRSFSG
jgi:hypothetical protein